MLSRAISKLPRLSIPARCFVGEIRISLMIRVSLVILLLRTFVLSVLMDLSTTDKPSKLHVPRFYLTRSMIYRRKCVSLKVMFLVIASSPTGWMLQWRFFHLLILWPYMLLDWTIRNMLPYELTDPFTVGSKITHSRLSCCLYEGNLLNYWSIWRYYCS